VIHGSPITDESAPLLANRFVPAALVMLGRDIVNIALYHALLHRRNWPIAVVNLVLLLVLAWGYRAYFAALLTKNARPHP